MFRCVFLLFLFQNVRAALPTQLTAKDRETAAHILTTAAAPKLMTSSEVLGGNQGIEVGLTYERIPMDQIARLGSKASQPNELSYYNLTIGKGFYYDFDFFIYFTPMPQDDYVTTYGAIARWEFFRGKNIPASLGLVFSTGSANYTNLIGTFSQAFDLVAGIQVDTISTYMGIGSLKGSANFSGGSNGVTDDQVSARVGVEEFHRLFGINFDLGNSFLAIQLDSYQDSLLNAKFGFRF